MNRIMEITSLSDPALVPFSGLTENQLKNRLHPGEGCFIAESTPVIRLALDAGIVPVSLLLEKKQITSAGKEILDRVGNIPVYTASDEILTRVTGFAPSRCVLAVMKRPVMTVPETLCENASRIAVLENVTDATNVGAIFRSAAALGIDAVLVDPSCCDPLNRRAARVSMGTVFQVPWTRIGENAADWAANGIDRLRSMGFVTAAMALKKDSVTIDDERLKKAPKLALLLGTEGTGLTESTIRNADYTVIIPMDHGVDSLNVAAASAVAFYETRKRLNTTDKETI